MPPKGKDTKAKPESAKGKDKGKVATEEKGAKGGAAKLKPATAINVRHILVRLPPLSMGYQSCIVLLSTRRMLGFNGCAYDTLCKDDTN